MKPLINIFGFLIFTLLVSLYDGFSFEKSKSNSLYTFQQIQVIDGVRYIVFADFDGDGNEEYFYTSVVKGLLLVDFDGQEAITVSHIVGESKVGIFQALDFIGDPSPEIFIPIKNKNLAWVEIWHVNSSYKGIECNFILRTEPVSGTDITNDGEWDGKFEQFQIINLNEDDQKDFIGCMKTGWDLEPRSIIAFDGKTGKILWKFPTAGIPYLPLCFDVDNDKKMEIIFGTWAPGNGNVSNNMTDSLSYLICLNNKGEIIWKNEMGGIRTATKYCVNDIDNDDEAEIICTFAAGDKKGKPIKFGLKILNAGTGKTEKRILLNFEFWQPFIADLDRDNESEIIITDTHGYIYIFNKELKLIKSSQLGTKLEACKIFNIIDLNNDGSNEIIVGVENKLFVLNDQLVKIGEYHSNMNITDAHYFEHPFYGELISITQSSLEEFRNSILLKIANHSPDILSVSKNRFNTVLLFVIFVLGVVSTLIVLKIIPLYLKRTSHSGSGRVKRHRDNLLETLAAFGHGKTATANLDRICFLFKNLPKNESPSREYRKRIDETLTTYFEFTSNQINNILKISHYAKIEIGCLNILEKNRKKLEKILEDYRNSRIKQNQMIKLSQSVLESVESLEENIEKIHDDIARFYKTDISAAVNEVLNAISPDLRKNDIKFKNFLIEGDVETKGFIDKTDFMTIFEELISNAISSMIESTKKEINIIIKTTDNKIFIEIIDTGCGIKKENKKNIFDRDYSTKKAGGFGLFHAKITLSKYGAKIKVLESELKIGTTIQIEIKKI